MVQLDLVGKKWPEDERTLSQLAREALDVQNACNLSGVALSFGRSVLRLRRLLEQQGQGGTKATNEHPIAMLWADKIASLTRTQSLGAEWVSGAYAAVEALAVSGARVVEVGHG